jgi:predicted tellurium resistance membrane protein TerC
MSQLLYLHSHREDSHLFIVVVLILSFPRRKESKVIEIGLLGTELVRFVII